MTSDTEGDTARLEYIANLLQSLIPLAKEADAEMLAYLLEMAMAEADDCCKNTDTYHKAN